MIVVESPAFAEGDELPAEYTCDGENVSPPLRWSDVPEGATELRVSVTDPDAPGGTFTHWLVRGLDASATGVERGEVPPGATEENNDFGDVGYGGPCPPSGPPHRYVFAVEGIDPNGQVLDAGRLTTTYSR